MFSQLSSSYFCILPDINVRYEYFSQIDINHINFRLDDYVLPPEVDLGRGHTAVVEDGGRQVESPPQPVVILVADIEAVDDQLAVDLFEV